MQTSQLQNIQRLDVQDAQCPDFPPMPKLSQLSLSFQPGAAQPVLPLPNLTMLEVLELDGVSCCPSLSCLSRLTRLSLTGRNPSQLAVYTASADILQSIKVCDACCPMFVCTNAIS